MEVKRMPRPHDIIPMLRLQLPRGLQDKFSVGLESDPFLLKATAIFKHESGQTWTCELEHAEIEGVMVPCRIPDAMLAQLCVVG